MEHSRAKRSMMYFNSLKAENTLEWVPISVDNNQLTTLTATNRGDIHKVNPNFESDAKLTSVVRT